MMAWLFGCSMLLGAGLGPILVLCLIAALIGLLLKIVVGVFKK